MIVHLLNFNYLVAFPACVKHGTFLPIMNVNRLGVKAGIKSIAKATDLVIWWLLDNLSILLSRFFFWLACLLLLFSSPFSTLWIYISYHVNLGLCLRFRLFWYNFSIQKCLFYLINLGRSKFIKTFSYFFPKSTIQLNNTFCCNSANILQLMLNTLNREFKCLIKHLWLNLKVIIRKYSC